MLKKRETFSKRMSNIALCKIAFGVFLMAFSCIPLQAMEREERDDNIRLSSLRLTCLQEEDHSLHKKRNVRESAFSWQSRQHFEKRMQEFEKLAHKELIFMIKKLIEAIEEDNKKQFFDHTHETLLSFQKTTIFNWMTREVLTLENFYKEDGDNVSENTCSDYEDETMRGYERAFMNGYYEGEDSSSECEEEQDNEIFSEGGSIDERRKRKPSWEEESEGEILERDFPEWQIDMLREMLDIDISSMEDFSEENIDINAIKKFLKTYCENGNYSWRLNEDIENGLVISRDFASLIYEEVGIPEDLINTIFGALWYEYDWEYFEIDDPKFLQKTYVRTLRSRLEGKKEDETKNFLVEEVKILFAFNVADFETPLREISKRYNIYIEQKNWLKALVEWSVYTTYRKVFENPAKKLEIRHYQHAIPSLPLFQGFNRETYVLKRMNDAYQRANVTYTKIYPHPRTQKIVFGPSRPGRAELDLQRNLGTLKEVGIFLEGRRRRGSAANVFVPEFYFIVSRMPNQREDQDAQHFLSVPLIFEDFPKRPLTRAEIDVVFKGVTKEEYLKRVKKDVIYGRSIQGQSPQDAKDEIDDRMRNKVFCNTDLVHSERGLVAVLHNPLNIQRLCMLLAEYLLKTSGSGLYTVYGTSLLGYSTNTVCPYCTPTLIALQNSHEPDGFLSLLVKTLNNFKGMVTFRTLEYDQEKGQTWPYFRLNIFITAKINFDSEAHDLAEDGQHSNGRVKKAPSTHNPHAKLFFEDDEIDLKDGSMDSLHRSFYEFVGKDIHSLERENPYLKGDLKYSGVVFSSGSESWGHNLLQ